MPGAISVAEPELPKHSVTQWKTFKMVLACDDVITGV